MYEEIKNLINNSINNAINDRLLCSLEGYNNDTYCQTLIMASDQKLYIWHDNGSDIKVKSYDLVKSVSFKSGYFTLRLNDEVITLNIRTEIYEAELLERMIKERSANIVEANNNIRKTKEKAEFKMSAVKSLFGYLIAIVVVIIVSVGATVGYVFITAPNTSEEDVVTDNRLEIIEKAKAEIEKSKNQVIGLNNYINAFEKYDEILDDLTIYVNSGLSGQIEDLKSALSEEKTKFNIAVFTSVDDTELITLTFGITNDYIVQSQMEINANISNIYSSLLKLIDQGTFDANATSVLSRIESQRLTIENFISALEKEIKETQKYQKEYEAQAV